MALLNRFSRLNDRGETGIFTFIVTKSVTRDFHRDATTKDFCFGYHRWAISFQRPSEKVLGVHLLLRNPSPNTACVVDFTLTLLNRQHFSQNESYTKKQAKFTITNPMQGVARWIQMSDLVERNFSSETGEFLFELALSNMSTIFECDIQLNAPTLNQYKSMLKNGTPPASAGYRASSAPDATSTAPAQAKCSAPSKFKGANSGSDLINLETNYFTFGAFDWSLTIVPLVLTPTGSSATAAAATSSGSSGSLSASGGSQLLSPNCQHSGSSASISSGHGPASRHLEPVCRVYLNRLSGFDSLCRVKYRVILGHHQHQQHQQQVNLEYADSRLLDQISDSSGRIRGYQFRNTNILKLISLRSSQQQGAVAPPLASLISSQQQQQQQQSSVGTALDLRVHIEMYCANTVSEARVPLQRKPNEAQVSNCQDRNKQAWCVESDVDSTDTVRLKLFFMDLQSVPRNHIRYISWIAYIVRRLPGGQSSTTSSSGLGSPRESIVVKNAPHSNYYLQDGMDMGTIMDTELCVKELNEAPQLYLENNQLTVHIEWVDSLLLFSHLYNSYDSLATIQRHQIRRELSALQEEFAHLESKYAKVRRSLNQVTLRAGRPSSAANPAQGKQLADTGDYLSTGSSGESLPDVVNSKLNSRETTALPPGARPTSIDEVELGQLHPRGAAGAQARLVEAVATAQQSVPPSDLGDNHINPGSTNNLPAQQPPTPIRLQRWPAYGGAVDAQLLATRRQLPPQPAPTNQPYLQRLAYGRLSEVSLDSCNSYRTRAGTDYELGGTRSMSPALMTRPCSQNLVATEDNETGSLNQLIRSACELDDALVYDSRPFDPPAVETYPLPLLTRAPDNSSQDQLGLEHLSIECQAHLVQTAINPRLLDSTSDQFYQPVEPLPRAVFHNVPEVGQLDQLSMPETYRYK